MQDGQKDGPITSQIGAAVHCQKQSDWRSTEMSGERSMASTNNQPHKLTASVSNLITITKNKDV